MAKKIERSWRDAENLMFKMELNSLEHEENCAEIDRVYDERKDHLNRMFHPVNFELEVDMETYDDFTKKSKTKANRRKKTASKTNNRKHLLNNMSTYWDNLQSTKESLGGKHIEKKIRYQNGDWLSSTYSDKKFYESFTDEKVKAKAREALRDFYYGKEAIETDMETEELEDNLYFEPDFYDDLYWEKEKVANMIIELEQKGAKYCFQLNELYEDFDSDKTYIMPKGLYSTVDKAFNAKRLLLEKNPYGELLVSCVEIQ